MSKEKSRSSCLGLFIKSWLVSVIALGGVTTAFVALGVRYFGWSSQAWMEHSSWGSYPVIAALGIAVVSTLVALSAAALLGLISAFLGGGRGGGGGKSGGSAPKSTPRVQSNRKTTV